MERQVTKQRGCPNCNMTCGNVIEDTEGRESELDYENVTMLGSNIGVGDLRQVATLNRMCDELGLDTIGAGNVISFAMEAAEKKLIDLDIDWGDFEGSKKLLMDLAYMRGHGATLGLGPRRPPRRSGIGAGDFTIQVKGLECSAYDCHLCPGMALSFGTSPIGAHHKDAWVISWEISSGKRAEYGSEKAEKVLEFQRIRGGMFESLVTCRFPWIELGLELDHYPEYFEAATGVKTSLDEMWTLGDRVYALIRAFWVREFGGMWDRQMDYPPKRWFDEPLTKGCLKGSTWTAQVRRPAPSLLRQEGLGQEGHTHEGDDEEAEARKGSGKAGEVCETELTLFIFSFYLFAFFNTVWVSLGLGGGSSTGKLASQSSCPSNSPRKLGSSKTETTGMRL